MKKYEMYFISNDYFNKFQDKGLMSNKGSLSNKQNGRPCYYCFKDKVNKDIYWLIPFSTQVAKYQAIYNKKVLKYGYCDTLRFGMFLGKQNAFLIQNMCPCIKKYLIPYIDKNSNPIKLPKKICIELEKTANEVLLKTDKKIKLLFPDVKKIYKELEKELEQEKSQNQKEPKETKSNVVSLDKKEPLDLKAYKQKAKEYNNSRTNNKNKNNLEK